MGRSHTRFTVAKLMLVAVGLTVSTACDPPQFVQRDRAAESQAVRAEAASMPDAKISIPASGDVLFIGGWAGGNKSTATSEFFDPNAKKFFRMGMMSATEAGAAGALVTVNSKLQVLVAGGFTGKSKFARPNRIPSDTITGSSLESLLLLDTTAGTFASATNQLDTPRTGATATTLNSGMVLIAGGVDANGHPVNTAEVFDPATQTLTEADNMMSSPRAFHTATLLGDGTVVLIGGGSDSSGGVTNTADIYDPGTNSFTQTTGNMIQARGGHAAVTLSTGPNSGKVLVIGGVNQSMGNFASFGTEVYNPSTKTFSSTASMSDSRAFPAATKLPDGTVLVTGGFTNFDVTAVSASSAGATLTSTFGSTLKSAEIYDPVADSFTCVPGSGSGGFICPASMFKARAAHSSTLLPSGAVAGQVLVAGGLGNTKPNSKSTELNQAELYDPSTQTFTKLPPMKSGRGFHIAVVMP
jgi:N-acetylneuraminic acid mutarotase